MRRSIRNIVLDALTVVVALCAVIATGSLVWSLWSSPTPTSGPTVTEIPDWRSYAERGHRIGDPHGAIVLVEFGDYECAVCRAFRPTLNKAIAAFGDSIQVVYRHSPLDRHPMGQLAARAAVCAERQERFEAYHAQLYAGSTWLVLGVSALEGLAEAVQISDLSTFSSCLRSLEPLPEIERDREAATRLGITGTPTVLVNGYRFDGVPDSTALFSLIRNELLLR